MRRAPGPHSPIGIVLGKACTATSHATSTATGHTTPCRDTIVYTVSCSHVPCGGGGGGVRSRTLAEIGIAASRTSAINLGIIIGGPSSAALISRSTVASAARVAVASTRSELRASRHIANGARSPPICTAIPRCGRHRRHRCNTHPPRTGSSRHRGAYDIPRARTSTPVSLRRVSGGSLTESNDKPFYVCDARSLANYIGMRRGGRRLVGMDDVRRRLRLRLKSTGKRQMSPNNASCSGDSDIGGCEQLVRR